MSSLRRFGSVAIALLLCQPLMAAPATQPALADQVAHLLKELDSDSYPDRQAAIEAAGKLPVEALPLLQAAEQRGDVSPDVRLDLDTVIKNLQLIASKRSKYQALSTFYRRHLLGEYDRVGKQNPAWDDAARQLLEAAAKQMADKVDERDIDSDPLQFAGPLLQAGCDDPLVAFLLARTPTLPTQKKLDAIAMDMEASNYSVLLKLWVVSWMADHSRESSRDPATKETKALGYFKQAIDLWPAAMEDDPAIPMDVVFNQAEAQLISCKSYGLDHKAAWTMLDAALAKALPEESLVRLNLKGWYLIEAAWDLRTDPATANTPATMKAYDDLLTQAETVFGRAYELFPNDPHAATAMLSLVRSKREGRASMEVWFARAMKANPENYLACKEKLWYLSLSWNGTKAEQLAFGRQCLDGGQFDSQIPLVVIDAHDALATPGPWAGEPVRPYFAQDDVWRDISAAFDGFLDQHPDAWRQRARYANYAWLAGNLQTAIDQYMAIEAAPAAYRKSDLLRVLKLSQAMHPANTPAADPTTRSVGQRQQATADFKRLLLDAYDRVGKKNSKWDAAARMAMVATASEWGNDPDRDFGEEDVMLESSKKAIDAGCDDPLVRFIYSNSYDSFIIPEVPAGKPIELADGIALANSSYPAFVRMIAATWASSFYVWRPIANDAERSKINGLLENGLGLVEKAAAERSMSDRVIRTEVSTLISHMLAMGDNADGLRRRVSAALQAGHADPTTIKGVDLNLQYAAMDYAERTNLLNYRFEPGRMQTTYDLHEVEQQWETLWQADPADPYPPQRILYISRRLHNERPWIDFWFHEAIRAEPSSRNTALIYLDELQWAAASTTDLQSYADQCAVMADYRSQIPFVDMTYLDRVARRNTKTGDKPDAVTLNTATTWSKIAGLYEAYLSKFPLDTRRRSEYASYACLTGRWMIAAEQLKILGDRAKVKAFYSQDRLDACRKHVEGLESRGFLPTTQPEE